MTTEPTGPANDAEDPLGPSAPQPEPTGSPRTPGSSDESAGMIAEMQRVYEVVKAAGEQFVIISFALNENTAEWKNAVEANNMNREGWLNACDAAGTESLAAELLGVEAAPKIVLVEPEGLAVSLNLETDEVLMRVEQILSGDLYYLDQID